MPQPRHELASLLFEALSTNYGIEVLVEDAKSFRMKLYAERKLNPAFAGLAFILPAAGNVWIVKKIPGKDPVDDPFL